MNRMIRALAILMMLVMMVETNPSDAQAVNRSFKSTNQIPDQQYGIPIQMLTADVTGDHGADQIVLYGIKNSPDSPYYEKLNVVVVSSNEKKITVTQVPMGGYNPYMKLCDMNGDGIADILVGAETGGSSGDSDYYLFTVKNNKSVSLPLPQPLTGVGVYQDHYLVQITIKETGKVYTLDLSHRKALYDREGIYKNGKLLKPVNVSINAFSKLEPIHAVNETQCSLVGIQRMSGIYNADTIGYIVSLWKWNSYLNNWSLMFASVEPSK
ncbi:hypothetical protein E0485_18250 [Paenibacillus albiflavus]|uniref:VCBS repeat-containing protein n=1 Tax=Paenibacillus albiflavus TaxID=2545760 RepID=A0A4R4EBM5_9BACL|nr:FG-GAP repeat protein [Paenibacillus albiflavus]TCZ75328.1 hypothetical protein E0485_18250 [Paenibacillus albiflavus]